MAITTSRLLRFSRTFQQFYAGRFAPMLARTGLSMREIQVLLFLVNNPGFDTARDMTEYRGLGKSQVSQAVELLAAQGLLRRTPDGGDRRVVHLSLTETGLPLAREAQALQSACGREMLSALSEEEQQRLFALLERVFDRVETAVKGEFPF